MSFIDSNGLAWEQHTMGVAPLVSLSAKSATNSVPAVLDATVVRTTAVLAITSSAGTASGAVTLQGSLDGVGFYPIGSAVTVPAASASSVTVTTGTGFRYLRAVISTVIGSGTVTVSVGASG
jgi:hypothetical protein